MRAGEELPESRCADPDGGGETGAPEGGEDGHRVSFYGIETNSARMLFILDFSGSMLFEGSDVDKSRKKIDVLYAELRKTLAGLEEGAKFNIVGFAADVRTWRKGPASADGKSRKEAMEWVEKQPVMGSTKLTR